ncbi:hypothetical protein TNCV_921841 [Trichonephila clavipes]|nr:hypothetical protein TNCV_921841 [Trichonephila clavipes]
MTERLHISAQMRQRIFRAMDWPACSPDLSCLDIFLWAHMKSLVYASPVDSNETLVARIAGEIRKMRGIGGTSLFSKADRAKSTDYSSKGNPPMDDRFDFLLLEDLETLESIERRPVFIP